MLKSRMLTEAEYNEDENVTATAQKGEAQALAKALLV